MEFDGGGLSFGNSGLGLSFGGGGGNSGLGLQGGLDTGSLGSGANSFGGYDSSNFSADYGLTSSNFDFGGLGLTGKFNTDNYGFTGGGGLGLKGADFGSNDFGGYNSVSPSGFADYSLAGPSNMSLNNPQGISGYQTGITDNGFLSKLSNMAKQYGPKIAQGILTAKFGPLAGLAFGMVNAAQKGTPGQYTGSTMGGMVGSSVAGPLGGFVGGQLGGRIGAQADSREASPLGMGAAAAASRNNNPMENGGRAFEDMASLYAASRTNTSPYSNTAGINQGRDLSSIYGSTGQYAKELRSQLERRDAAAGRRSQYGPRETELMVKLAELEARQRNSDSQTNISERNQAYSEQVMAENRRRQRDASYVKFLQGTGIANDIAGLF